jgi:hypothetical protein
MTSGAKGLRVSCTLVTALGVLLSSSCASKRKLYPVRGQVFAGGKPAAGALVVFQPADDPSPQALRPSGQVEADGSFTLSSYSPAEGQPRDGAPAGEYRVSISWFPPNAKELLGKNGITMVPDRLGGRYGDPKTSGLQAKVSEGTNELPAFQLELKK